MTFSTRSPLMAICVLTTALLAAPAVAPAEPAPANATSCDRDCLIGFMNRYLDAVVAHDPSKIQKAVRVRFTEDGQQLTLGDGLWGTATARGAYSHYFPDPQTGNIGFFGTMRENGQPVLLAARLKIVDRKVAEIETIVPRDHTPMAKAGIARLEEMQHPGAIWNEDVPAAERMSRAALIRTANKYFTGLQRNKPKGDYSFFADDCNRLENGMQTTNAKPSASAQSTGGTQPDNEGAKVMTLGCRAQFSTGFFQMVTRIRDRRFLAVDVQKGVVFSFVFFDHDGQVRQETLADGRTIPVDLKAPFTWELAEAFKIEKGHIRRIEAVMKQAPYGMKPGWSEKGLGYDPATGPQ